MLFVSLLFGSFKGIFIEFVFCQIDTNIFPTENHHIIGYFFCFTTVGDSLFVNPLSPKGSPFDE